MIDIHAIRAANPLPDIAAKLVALRPAGREWVACCPFHADRSPSFTIYDGGTRFHCFGCGASGDVLDFVQRAYDVDMIGAARGDWKPVKCHAAAMGWRARMMALMSLAAVAPKTMVAFSPG